MHMYFFLYRYHSQHLPPGKYWSTLELEIKLNLSFVDLDRDLILLLLPYIRSKIEEGEKLKLLAVCINKKLNRSINH